MNSFPGHITDINTNGAMSIVGVEMDGGEKLMSIVIDTPESAPYLKMGNKVNVLFKELEVAVSTQTELDISIENRIAGKITNMEMGVLLSRLTLETSLGVVIAIISSMSVGKMGLGKGMNVMIMVKLNEIILAP
ncbi:MULTISPECIES: molybdopterin-binding protein [unclassified Arenibacter]|jgi:molybdopterin-binding protein|uniref:TOBE domain-containing protein n=1 Tax=unclassified Arenibacter TaxID=2615047 RepID=UPI000E34F3B6|nr:MULTISPECIES: TOBE domain-containing protein [unclassified Arenibacter]MCM4164989.1 tobe domain protein [Arenibacter sp. A80]RFT55394.1 tobe domain protein [Arenibacter sp. P308M17]